MALLSNLYVVLILRILHIGGGIMWVGSAALYLLLLIPAARTAQSAGQKFLQTLGPKFGAMMGMVTTVTVLSGALLWAGYGVLRGAPSIILWNMVAASLAALVLILKVARKPAASAPPSA